MADNVNRLLIVEDEPEVVEFIAEVGRKARVRDSEHRGRH